MPINNKVQSDGYEVVPYNDARYPVFFNKLLVRKDEELSVLLHWHDDFEFLYAKKGRVKNRINGKTVCMEEGQALFVNSGILHTQEFGTEECEYICILLHPSLFSGNERIMTDFVLSLKNYAPYLLLDRVNPGGLMIIDNLLEIFRMLSEDFERNFPSVMSRAWEMISELTSRMSEEAETRFVPDLRTRALHAMIGFIQQHYTDRVTLDELSEAGHVSKSECNLIFRTQTHNTPFEYLNRYRLMQVRRRLFSGLSIAEIASECGFSSQSYLAETFKKYYHKTISEYRKEREKA